MGGCSMSDKLCYFCREHEMRPLPTGKKHPRCFQVTGCDLGNSNNTPPCDSLGVNKWPQTHPQYLTEMDCLARVLEVSSRSVFAVHQQHHLSSGRGRGGGGDWGRDLLIHSDWKLDLWISSLSSLQLHVSPSHVMCNSRKDHLPSCHVMGFSLSSCDLSGSSSLTHRWVKQRS